MGRERNLTERILEWARPRPDASFFKTTGNVVVGMPDLFGHVRGRAVWVEVKKQGGKVSAIQALRLKTLRDEGAKAFVAYDWQDFQMGLDGL